MPDPAEPVLCGLDRAEAEAFFAARGLEPFRARQVQQWIFSRRVFDFAAMTDLPAARRPELAAACRALDGEVAATATGADGTRKALVRFADGQAVEAVAIPAPGRLTLCLSTQVGCPVGCSFCATGRLDFQRSLAPAEIVAQALLVTPPGAAPHNVVFMGMGEPFLNYEATLKAARIIAAPWGLGLGQRRISVSTAGLPAGIDRFAGEPEQFRLALSLHAPDQARREKLIPLARRHPLPEVLAAIERYQRATRRQVTFEYLLLGGFNDDAADARALARLLRGRPGAVNLIPCNPVPGSEWRAPAPEAVRRFAVALERAGRRTTVRREKGQDIAAACGQLAGAAKFLPSRPNSA